MHLVQHLHLLPVLTHTQQILGAFLLAATYLVLAPPYSPYKAPSVVHPEPAYAFQLDLT